MRIKQSEVFSPITITLETKIEAVAAQRFLSYLADIDKAYKNTFCPADSVVLGKLADMFPGCDSGADKTGKSRRGTIAATFSNPVTIIEKQ
jgi:hypothetical protein